MVLGHSLGHLLNQAEIEFMQKSRADKGRRDQVDRGARRGGLGRQKAV